MKTPYMIIIIGTVIIGIWFSGLAFVQITHIPIEYFAGTVSYTSIDDNGVKIETVGVAPEFTILPITGISLIVVGAFYALWRVEK
ncbi:hypothetical protein NKOR_06175 [Candidatus Nitrosopumilus koreensis AR1]|uniref:Uncharacterized protein n=1 Tax=Candidatus Nitrosopumilus koreensis AR1 TaxID=1229908 RepID=K0B9H8_9ARCH|nr:MULTISPECIES: hypothetical protein [Nitrosopumilus]AFS81116.1 hypothetical protein NKOR_06175 [Candidatus Nitrosopumilus koreensis AR1]